MSDLRKSLHKRGSPYTVELFMSVLDNTVKRNADLRAALLRDLGAIQVTDRPDASAPPGRVWSGEVPLNEGDWIVPAKQPEEAK